MLANTVSGCFFHSGSHCLPEPVCPLGQDALIVTLREYQCCYQIEKQWLVQGWTCRWDRSILRDSTFRNQISMRCGFFPLKINDLPGLFLPLHCAGAAISPIIQINCRAI